jgi:hypothetical protein
MTDYYPFESTWEIGDFSEWTSKVDTQPKFTVDHVFDITKTLGSTFSGVVPYRGAYVGHIDVSIGTTAAYVQQTDVVAAAATQWWRFYFQATHNLTMATSDRFTIFALQGVANADQGVIDIANVAGVIQLVCANTSATAIGAGTRGAEFARDVWHLIEIGATIDAGGGNDGTLQFWLDGQQVGSTITGLDQIAVAQARLGYMNGDAGTTAGHLLFDQIVQSAAQIGGFHNEYPQTVILTKSGFVYLGPGKVEEYILNSGGAADNTMTIHDLARQPLLMTNDMFGSVLTNSHLFETRYAAFSKKGGYYNRGCYVNLTGTAPRATITFSAAIVGLGAIRDYAARTL